MNKMTYIFILFIGSLENTSVAQSYKWDGNIILLWRNFRNYPKEGRNICKFASSFMARYGAIMFAASIFREREKELDRLDCSMCYMYRTKEP